MKIIKLLAFLAFAILLTRCGTTESPVSNGPSLTEVTFILKTTEKKFLEYFKSNPGEPQKAMELTKIWLRTQPTVSSAETIDSVNINITLKSGLETSFFINEIGVDGLSVYRGGGKPNTGSILVVEGKKSKNVIENKNVLIFAPAYSDFYGIGEMENIVAILNKSRIVKTTLLKDKECSYETIASFKNYGLVIIDTHGDPDFFLAGNQIDTAEGDKEEIFKSNVAKGAGANAYAKLQSKELKLSDGFKFVRVKNELIKYPHYNINVTSKYIEGLPKMPETVIFGNMCYSGWTAPLENGNTPIGTAFINKEPISYYCYMRDNKRSWSVEDGFSKRMESYLVSSLVIDGDSTGIAHLDADGKSYFDPYIATQTGSDGQKVYLYLKQFGAVDYSYSDCIDVFTDNRDGIIYKTVCMGKQIWMAENLRYNAPGSVFYDDNPANGPIYGKLYDWATVMNGAASTNANPSGVQGICPKGWHVPSSAEWDYLNIVTVGNKGGDLKDKNLWKAPNLGATDLYGFSARGGGFSNSNGSYVQLNNIGWWTTTHGLNNGVELYQLNYWTIPLVRIENGFATKVSCRCVKD